MQNRKFFLGILLSLLLTGCVGTGMSQSPPPFVAQDLASGVRSGQYTKKVDTFLLIFDASSSMFDNSRGCVKFRTAMDTASNLNATLPELAMESGLRVYGPNLVPWQGYNTLVYGMTTYRTGEMQDALDGVRRPAGTSPLAKALSGAATDLAESSGKIALVIITDAEVEAAPTLVAANRLQEQFGGRICVYPIQVGDSVPGRALMAQLAQTTGCGFVSQAEDLATPAAMADFVKKVFFAKGRVERDSDGDGVLDSRDRCPGTARGIAVDAAGCPKDSDGDGVYDSFDRCPDTPRGRAVDRDGCPVADAETVTMSLDIKFDTNQAAVKPAYHDKLAEFAAFMQKYPGVTAVIEAHTDNVGAPAYNQRLSQRRAESVIRYLVDRFNIDAGRLTARGYGPDRPIASNDTAEGRRRNRRVEAVVSTTVSR